MDASIKKIRYDERLLFLLSGETH